MENEFSVLWDCARRQESAWLMSPLLLCGQRPCTSWRLWTYLQNGAGVGGGLKAHRHALVSSQCLWASYSLRNISWTLVLYPLTTNLPSLLSRKLSASSAGGPLLPGGNISLPTKKWNFSFVSFPVYCLPFHRADQLMLLFLILDPCLIFSMQWRLRAKLLLLLQCHSALGVAFICHRGNKISRPGALLGSG